jgi:hypothetical protein
MDFEAIWNGPGYRNFRETLHAERPGDACRVCVKNGTPRNIVDEVRRVLA